MCLLHGSVHRAHCRAMFITWLDKYKVGYRRLAYSSASVRSNVIRACFLTFLTEGLLWHCSLQHHISRKTIFTIATIIATLMPSVSTKACGYESAEIKVLEGRSIGFRIVRVELISNKNIRRCVWQGIVLHNKVAWACFIHPQCRIFFAAIQENNVFIRCETHFHYPYTLFLYIEADKIPSILITTQVFNQFIVMVLTKSYDCGNVDWMYYVQNIVHRWAIRHWDTTATQQSVV